jgi:ribosomal protein S12 methylthiotransferase
VRYFLDPFGCAKNQVDAETMMALLNGEGWSVCENAENADLIIVNSCAFIDKAKQESINAVLAWRGQYPGKKILLSGCLAQRYAKELPVSLPEADALLGSGELTRVTEAAAKLLAGAGAPGRGSGRFHAGLRPLLGFPGSAYVKISEGCDNHCSFCAIPLIRGSLKCREIPGVAAECGELLDRGIKELCLIGQDLASYRSPPGSEGAKVPPQNGLSELLAALTELEGFFWVRLLYLHPDHFPLDMLEIIKSDDRLLPYFDIPFQHGSDRILKAMNRRGNAALYLELLEKIRNALPGAVIRSTFLTGFPGETEEDFRELLEFQEAARFDWLGVFTYSREEGTAAYAMKGRVDKKTAAARKALIEEKQLAITEESMNRFIGRELDVLVEETFISDQDDDLYLGRLYCQAPEVDGAVVIRSAAPLVPGTMVPGRVVARAGFDLEVEVEDPL